MPETITSALQPGDPLKGFTRLVSQSRINSYADASGDHNPIHLDESYARQTRFGQRIAHGMLNLAFVWEMLAMNFPETWSREAMIKVRFTSPVLPGETVRVSGTATRIREDGALRWVECKVQVDRPGGDAALSGTATALIKD